MSHEVARSVGGPWVVVTSSKVEDCRTIFYDRREAEREAALLNSRDDAHESFALFDEEDHLS